MLQYFTRQFKKYSDTRVTLYTSDRRWTIVLGGYQKSGAFPDLDSKSSRSWVQFRFSAIRFQFSGFEYVMDKSEVLLHTSGKLENPLR